MSEGTVVSFFIDAPPVPKARVRHGSKGVYTPDATAAYEALVGWRARAAMRGLVRNDVDDLGVRATFGMPTRHRSDLDNLLKSLFDGMNGIVWKDDSQVVDIEATLVRAAEKVGTQVEVFVFEPKAVRQ